MVSSSSCFRFKKYSFAVFILFLLFINVLQNNSAHSWEQIRVLLEAVWHAHTAATDTHKKKCYILKILM